MLAPGTCRNGATHGEPISKTVHESVHKSVHKFWSLVQKDYKKMGHKKDHNYEPFGKNETINKRVHKKRVHSIDIGHGKGT